MRLLSYNIRHGGVGREEALLAVIKRCNPDIVVFQEATTPAVIERLAAGAAMPHWSALPRHSLGFMSRMPIELFARPRPRISRHAFLEIAPVGLKLRIFGVHLSAVHSAWTEHRRVLELRALLRSITQHQHGFHVLAGDFNTLAPGELLDVKLLPHRLRALVWLSGGRIRWRTIQQVLDFGYLDAYRAVHPEGGAWTFPTWAPHLRLDYVFTPAGYIDRIRECEVVTGSDATLASDHFPLLAELDVD